MAAQFQQTGLLSYEESVELIEESQIELTLDLGHSLVYRLKHPEHGSLIVVNSSVGSSGVLSA